MNQVAAAIEIGTRKFSNEHGGIHSLNFHKQNIYSY